MRQLVAISFLSLVIFSSCRSPTDQKAEIQVSERASSARAVLLSAARAGIPDEIGNALDSHLRPWLHRLSDQQVLDLVDAGSRGQLGAGLLSVADDEVEVRFATLVMAIESGNTRLVNDTSHLLAQSLGLASARIGDINNPAPDSVTLEYCWQLAEQEYGVRSFYSGPVYVRGRSAFSGKDVYHLPFELWNGLTPRQRAELVDEAARRQPENWEFVLGRVIEGDVMYDKVIAEKWSHVWNAEYAEWSW